MMRLPRQCAVLVGGLGTRLGALTHATPKPLLSVAGRPFLVWLLREALRWGIEDVLLLTGHLSWQFQAAVADLVSGLPRAVSVRLSIEPAPVGTGGALRHALNLLDERFLLLNGDSVLAANLGPALAAFALDGAETACRMVLRPAAEVDRYGVATLEGDRVLRFANRVERGGPGLVNSGIYLMKRGVAEAALPVCSVEADLLPSLALRGALYATVADGWFIDIGVPSDLARARAELSARMRRPALLLDRDCVIDQNRGWLGSCERWVWIPGAQEAIRRATAAGWHVFVVTNQAGVAHGLYSEHDVQSLHAWMGEEMRIAAGTIDDVRYCPFDPKALEPACRRTSNWRKLKPEMILDLIRRWDLDLSNCLLIGDHPHDVDAAAAAGIDARCFPGGDLNDFLAPMFATHHFAEATM